MKKAILLTLAFLALSGCKSTWDWITGPNPWEYPTNTYPQYKNK